MAPNVQFPRYDAAGYPNFPGGSAACHLFGPDELNHLQAVFDATRQECGIASESELARALGRSLIRYYGQGQRDPAMLQAMLVASFKRRSDRKR